jgi:hypothetical protein
MTAIFLDHLLIYCNPSVIPHVIIITAAYFMLFLRQNGSVLKEYFSLHSYFLRSSYSLFLFGLLYRRYVQVINLICLHLVFRFKICDMGDDSG